MALARFSDDELRVITWLMVVVFSLLTFAVPLTSGNEVDVDELVYVQTLESMQEGQGYYPAMRDALIAKEGAPPTQIRSFRTPVVFWLLAMVPSGLWHLAALVPFAASIGLSVPTAKPFGSRAALIAVAGVGTMAVAYSNHLYLHAEVWALPSILGGLLALRNNKAYSPWLLAFGLATRELYAVLFGVCMVYDWLRNSSYRRHWLGAGASVSMFGLIHANRAADFVAETGYEAPFGNEKLNPTFVFSAISPGVGWLSWTLGVAIVVFGAFGLARVIKSDPIAPLVAAHVMLMLPVTLVLGRVYWGYTFVPLLALYVAAVPPTRQLSDLQSSKAKQLAGL